jgi:AraC-like DNA-binding protein
MTEHRWQGSALLRSGVLAFTGSIGATDRHAHHAVQIITAATPVTVVDEDGNRNRGTEVTVPADASHWIETGAARGSTVFLDPESAAGRVAHHRALDVGWTADAVLGRAGDRGERSDGRWRRRLADVVDDLINQLTPTPAGEQPDRHAAVRAAMDLLPSLVGAGAVRGTEVAAHVHVSTSRLTHLFTDQVGIPLRRYVLWLRLRIAITRVQAGDDLTDAAHAAGFADSAHLTRTCRDMFGLPPSLLSRHVSWDIATTG